MNEWIDQLGLSSEQKADIEKLQAETRTKMQQLMANKKTTGGTRIGGVPNGTLTYPMKLLSTKHLGRSASNFVNGHA
jgi:hypothetical protein